METPTSSRYVTGGHAFAYFCKLCRAEMPFEQRESHNRAIHPDLLERQQRAYARNMRIVITAVVGSGAGFFLGLFVPATILGIHVPVWYIVAIFLAMFAGFFVPFPYVAKTRRIYFEDVGGILVPCVICSAKIGERELRSHFASVHPEEFRHFRTSFWIVRICPNGILLYGILAATFLTWFRRLGVAAVCGMGRALRFLGGPWPSPLGEGSGCLAGFARSGSAAPSMSEPAG